MHTPDITESNIEKIGQLFPNCLTEHIGEDGKVEKVIDFDMLRQELSKEIVEGPQERYQFTWPDKKKAIRLANTPSSMTLRPCREESVDFDNTKNLYIEGDNLEVLKLLRENYLSKIKVIYIDPPYNTGNDFVYEDDYSQSEQDYLNNSGQEDMLGYRLVQNTESNGRFHTDWLNMIYPRLRVAKDLLSSEGVIFISIDDHEFDNLKKVCDEIFGPNNFVSDISWQRTYAPRNDSKGISAEKEHLIVYSKNIGWNPYKLPRTAEMDSKYGSIDGDPNKWRPDNPCAPGATTHQGMVYAIQNPFTGELLYPTNGACWRYQQRDMLKIMEGWAKYKLEDLHDEERRGQVCGVTKDTVRRGVLGIVIDGTLSEAKESAKKVLDKGNWPLYYFTRNGEGGIAKKTYLNPDNGKVVTNLWPSSEVGNTDEAKKELLSLFDGKAPFDTPKPTRLIKRILDIATKEEGIILDFFSGSATTAHAVFLHNFEKKSSVNFILVQIPEKLDNPYYKNICEVGKDRIRLAGKKIKTDIQSTSPNLFSNEPLESFDFGFRVLKLDSSNMNDVFYRPEDFREQLIKEDNVKEGRTPEDLLFQVMLECNLPLSANITSEKMSGKDVYIVNNGYLIACFDKNVNEAVIKSVAKRKPYYFIMRDSSLASDNVADNFEQIFQAYSKETIRRIL